MSTINKRVVILKRSLASAIANWNGALMFYTCLPIPHHWPLAFDSIARWVPWVGVIIGGLLAITDRALLALQAPVPVCSALIVALWIALTGGLHLDGVMDTADGLAVPDKSRRLAVMTDSRMGAFGGMAVAMLLLLKVVALSNLDGNLDGMTFTNRAFGLVAVCVWGRWGQQWAIARYPYLKKTGKGAFHKSALPSIQSTFPSFFAIGLLSGALVALDIVSFAKVLQTTLAGTAIALLTSAYFYRQLGGHTGDTYGAVVEWTETLLLCVLTVRAM
ncbi:MAG: adenosylcobinamide-GDP ribazoletransferase [Cyanobacteria bacterium P01_C01_bin.69]